MASETPIRNGAVISAALVHQRVDRPTSTGDWREPALGLCHFGCEEFVMSISPSITPQAFEQDIYLVLEDFSTLARAWCETDEAGTNRAALVINSLEGQYEIRAIGVPKSKNICPI